MTLILPSGVADDITAHARGGAPEEVVGVLAGERDADGRTESTVDRLYRAENAASKPETRYEIAPAAELELLERVEAAGLHVVGFYHSHPRGPAEPSSTDERLAAWPGHSYVIVALDGSEPTIGSWRWSGEAFEREAIESR